MANTSMQGSAGRYAENIAEKAGTTLNQLSDVAQQTVDRVTDAASQAAQRLSDHTDELWELQQRAMDSTRSMCAIIRSRRSASPSQSGCCWHDLPRAIEHGPRLRTGADAYIGSTPRQGACIAGSRTFAAGSARARDCFAQAQARQLCDACGCRSAQGRRPARMAGGSGIRSLVLVVTAWLAAVVALGSAASWYGMSWPAVLGLAALLNLAGALIVVWSVKHVFEEAPFAATLKQIKSPGDDAHEAAPAA